MALEVYDIARVEGIVLNPDIETDFQDFARKITKITEEEITSQSSAGLSLSQIIILKHSREARTRECLRIELDQKISDLIQKLNWLIVERVKETVWAILA
jgi:hypothetical protein